MDLEDFDIWWNTVCEVVEDSTGVSLKKRDEDCFRPAYEAGRCAHEVARGYVEDMREGWAL